MTKVKYSKEEIEKAISECYSWREVADWFKVKPRSGTQSYIRNIAIKYNISTEHFLGSKWNIRILCPNCHSQTDTFRAKNINRICAGSPKAGGKRLKIVTV